METLVPAATCHAGRIRVATERPVKFSDLTDRIIEAPAAGAGTHATLANIQSRHTRMAIAAKEREPRLLPDFAALLGRALPRHASSRHDGRDASEVDHGRTPQRSCAVPRLAARIDRVAELRRRSPAARGWQRGFLVELGGPRIREVSVLLFGEHVRKKASSDPGATPMNGIARGGAYD